jgi:hypothetical protein
MSTLPFSISSDAAKLIQDLFHLVDEKTSRTALVPILLHCRRFEARNREGDIIERCLYPHFDLGWDSPDNDAFADFPAVEVFGKRLLIEPQALEMLRGKELKAEVVEVGYPNPADVKRRLLTCT